MAKGIVLDNCNNVLIDSNTFDSLDIAVEAKDSRNIKLTRNKIRYIDPRINQLLREIDISNLPISSKRELAENIVHAILSGQKRVINTGEKESLLIRIKTILGKTAWELSKAIISDVIAGKMLIKIANLD